MLAAMRAGLALVIGLVAAVACSTGGSPVELPRDDLGRAAIVLDQADDSRSVGMTVGATVAVRLPSDAPGGGSGWRVDGELDERVLRLVSSAYRPGTTAAGGQAVLTFQAVGPGSVTVHLTYGPRDNPEGAAREFTFVVSVT